MKTSRGRHAAPRRARHAAPPRRGALRTGVIAVATTALVGVAGGAYAFWSGVANGDATAGATRAVALGVTSVTAPAVDLYPGKTSDLSFVLSNGNPYPVSLTTLTAASVTSSDEASCKGSTYISLPAGVTTALAGGGYTLPNAVTVPAGSTSTTGTLAGFMTMSTGAPDACQGKTFKVALSFSGSQV